MKFKSSKCGSYLFQYKDRFQSVVSSNVVNKFSCSGCYATYYGKTTRNLLIRCNENLTVNSNVSNLIAPSSMGYGKQTGNTASIQMIFRKLTRLIILYYLLIHERLLIQRDRPLIIRLNWASVRYREDRPLFKKFRNFTRNATNLSRSAIY